MARLILRPGDRDQIADRLPLTLHALRRAARRHIRLTDIQYVLRHGRVSRAWRGMRFRLDRAHVTRRPSARGIVVVVDLGRRIPTVFREER